MTTLPDLNFTASRRWGSLSPLRYPGGKASLAGLFANIITELGLHQPVYVEPYAGGAGAGVALLRHGLISHLVINDFDKAVYAFWTSITSDPTSFVQWVKTVPLTVDEWRRQRQAYQAQDTSDLEKLGHAFFYLNRTNRSGVLTGGIIGGNNQTGNYLMDARFNRETLADRIAELGKLSHRITVTREDGRTTITRYQNQANTFLYIDPPYVQAGKRLYLNAFDDRDHETLASIMATAGEAAWLMTYDVNPLITYLYRNHYMRTYTLTYASHHPGKVQELLIASPDVGHTVDAISREA